MRDGSMVMLGSSTSGMAAVSWLCYWDMGWGQCCVTSAAITVLDVTGRWGRLLATEAAPLSVLRGGRATGGGAALPRSRRSVITALAGVGKQEGEYSGTQESTQTAYTGTAAHITHLVLTITHLVLTVLTHREGSSGIVKSVFCN